jgi:hypothetical protein
VLQVPPVLVVTIGNRLDVSGGTSHSASIDSKRASHRPSMTLPPERVLVQKASYQNHLHAPILTRTVKLECPKDTVLFLLS